MNVKKHLSISGLRQRLSEAFTLIVDERQPNKVSIMLRTISGFQSSILLSDRWL